MLFRRGGKVDKAIVDHVALLQAMSANPDS
jgi:hypothetical protein